MINRIEHIVDAIVERLDKDSVLYIGLLFLGASAGFCFGKYYGYKSGYNNGHWSGMNETYTEMMTQMDSIRTEYEQARDAYIHCCEEITKLGIYKEATMTDYNR